jgi:hypothetical protein
MWQKRVHTVFVALGLLACFGYLRAEEAVETEHDHEGVHCLRLNVIKRSEVLDNRHILFEMRNGDLYVNTLARACPGLSRNNAFMYRTSLSELCDLDIITVLDNIGFGLRPGISCGLGLFVPIKKEELDGLKKAIKDARLE